MSDNEVEDFEITDYDLENEFNINRPRKKQSKNYQIYGIWADDSDDEDDGRPVLGRAGFGAKSSKRSARGDVSAPISFVAGGVQQPGKDKKGKEGAGSGSEEENGEEEPEGSRRGFGRIADSSSEESDDGGSRGRRDKRYQSESRGMSSSSFSANELAGMRKKGYNNTSSVMQKGVGNWERHTKGIGAKLLLQMGYQPGKGLGKELQGISAPVEAHLRKGRGAIGAYGPEKLTTIADLRPETKTRELMDEEEGKEGGKLSHWRKEGSNKAKVRYVYKSVDDVLEDQGKTRTYKREFNELSKVKVIDMTGPQQRVLSGYHAISGPQRPADEWEHRKDKKFSNFALPELQHNLNLLVDLCEQDIIANDRKLRHAKDRSVHLEQEEISLGQKIEAEGKQLSSLETVLSMVKRLEGGEGREPITLDEAADIFKQLQDEHYEEFSIYEMASLAPDLLQPLLAKELVVWAPLAQPKRFLDVFRLWRDLLENDTTLPATGSITMLRDPYHRLLWGTWMPHVRAAINIWNCRYCDPLITLLETWRPLLPLWMMENILEQQIMPRIEQAVEDWNPLTDTIPIHTWIHPWVQFLGPRLEVSVYPIIRHKLSVALVNWHPSDRSAFLMITPWHRVFSRADMDAFLIKNILPKLQMVMQEFIVNPHQQHLDNWNVVMEWKDLLPLSSLVTLLDQFFFPKWLQVLALWLNHSPDYEQVSNWYTGWKRMLSDAILQQPVIKDHFNKALEMMNRAVTNPGQPVAAPTSEPPSSYPEPVVNNASRFEPIDVVRASAQMPGFHRFRDLVQKRCEERGIVFMPIVNRYQQGKPVYRMGNIQVYVDHNVLFAIINGTWQPTSLNTALEMAVS